MKTVQEILLSPHENKHTKRNKSIKLSFYFFSCFQISVDPKSDHEKHISHPIWDWFEAGSELLWGLWQRFSLNLNQENRMTKSWPTKWRLNSSPNLLCKTQKHRRRDWSSIWRLDSLSNWAISHIWLVVFQNTFQILTTPSTTWEMTIMKSTTSWLEAYFQKNVCWKLTSKLRANANNQHPDWGSFLFCSRNPT